MVHLKLTEAKITSRTNAAIKEIPPAIFNTFVRPLNALRSVVACASLAFTLRCKRDAAALLQKEESTEITASPKKHQERIINAEQVGFGAISLINEIESTMAPPERESIDLSSSLCSFRSSVTLISQFFSVASYCSSCLFVSSIINV